MTRLCKKVEGCHFAKISTNLQTQVAKKFDLIGYEDFWPIRWMVAVYLQRHSRGY
jgi:hypothetical protein